MLKLPIKQSANLPLVSRPVRKPTQIQQAYSIKPRSMVKILCL